MLRFKVLKHNDLPDTFGVFQSRDEGMIKDADTEIYHSSTPELLRETATIDDLKSLYKNTTAIDQLKDYKLVTVWLM